MLSIFTELSSSPHPQLVGTTILSTSPGNTKLLGCSATPASTSGVFFPSTSTMLFSCPARKASLPPQQNPTIPIFFPDSAVLNFSNHSIQTLLVRSSRCRLLQSKKLGAL